MADQKIPGKYWNIYARELEYVLAAHHLQMDALVDQAGVSTEKVRHLIRSLHTPKELPVLDREETRLLERKLTTEEGLRLRAGLLAIFIQRTFVDRIDEDDALLLAEQAFPTIFQALQAQAQGGPVTHDTTRGGGGDPIDDDEFEVFFESTLRTLNDAVLELQMSYGVRTQATRIARALTARNYFEQAFAELQDADDSIRASQLWRDSYAASQRGLKNANKRLEDLGYNS